MDEERRKGKKSKESVLCSRAAGFPPKPFGRQLIETGEIYAGIEFVDLTVLAELEGLRLCG
jgi:hypothetical protein